MLARQRPVRFIDLPAGHRLGSVDELPESAPPPLHRDPLSALAQAAGESDGESWWNGLVEQSASGPDVFTAISDAMGALRQALETETPITAREAQREAHMRREIGNALGETDGQGAVICGAQMAKRFDLHTTDLEVLDLIFIRGEVSAGELAKATGLTSGSMTALIDRLMEKKYVTRREDPNDRRKTLVKLNMKAIAPIAEAYMPRQKAMFKLWSSYSATELAVIFDFIQRSTELLVHLTDREPSTART